MAPRTPSSTATQPWPLAFALLFASAATLVGLWLLLEPYLILQRAAGSALAGALVGRLLRTAVRSLHMRTG